MAKWDTDLISVCGHVGTKVVQYGDRRNDGRLNSICTACFNSGLYYVQEVLDDDVDVILEGGRTITINPKTEIQFPYNLDPLK